MNVAFAVDLNTSLEGVFIVFRLLKHRTHALCAEFYSQPFTQDPFALVQFLDGDAPFLAGDDVDPDVYPCRVLQKG